MDTTEMYTKEERHFVYTSVLEMMQEDRDFTKCICTYIALHLAQNYWMSWLPELYKYKPEGLRDNVPYTTKDEVGFNQRIEWLKQAVEDTKIQQLDMEEITIYKFQLETIIDALRMTSNALGCDKQETCLDRHVVQAKRYADNALKGDKDKEVRYGSKLP